MIAHSIMRYCNLWVNCDQAALIWLVVRQLTAHLAWQLFTDERRWKKDFKCSRFDSNLTTASSDDSFDHNVVADRAEHMLRP